MTLAQGDFLSNILNVGGGGFQADLALRGLDLAQANEQGRQQQAMNLLQTLLGVQQNPFSIVPATQAFGAAGGGTLAPAASLAATGGQTPPSPFGGIVDKLLRNLSEFTGATPINPNTGAPFTPLEMNFLRIVGAREQGQQAGGAVQQMLPQAQAAPAPAAPQPTAFTFNQPAKARRERATGNVLQAARNGRRGT